MSIHIHTCIPACTHSFSEAVPEHGSPGRGALPPPGHLSRQWLWGFLKMTFMYLFYLFVYLLFICVHGGGVCATVSLWSLEDSLCDSVSSSLMGVHRHQAGQAASVPNHPAIFLAWLFPYVRPCAGGSGSSSNSLDLLISLEKERWAAPACM